MSTLFSVSSNIMKKSIPLSLSTPSTAKPSSPHNLIMHRIPNPLSLYYSCNPPEKTPPEFPSVERPSEYNPYVPQEMPRTPDFPEFEPEKIAIPTPDSVPEIPIPPMPSPPGPEIPQPPMPSPPGPDMPRPPVPDEPIEPFPPNAPDVIPPKPPESGPPPQRSPEIPRWNLNI